MSSKVVSPAGNEIGLDDMGRYKLKMYFDKNNSGTEAQTPYIRLNQPYSGTGYGIHFPNHANTEMIWACINGDADRPLGLGTVPNASNNTPFQLEDKYKNIIKTAGNSELSFDDKPGEEKILLQSEKDFSVIVKNNKTESVDKNSTSTIGGSKAETIGSSLSMDIGSDMIIQTGNTLKISSGLNLNIETNEALIIQCGNSAVELNADIIKGSQVKIKSEANFLRRLLDLLFG